MSTTRSKTTTIICGVLIAAFASPVLPGCAPTPRAAAPPTATRVDGTLDSRRAAFTEALSNVRRFELIVWTINENRIGDVRIGPVIVDAPEAVGTIAAHLSKGKIELCSDPFAKYSDISEIELVGVTHRGPDFKARISAGDILHLFADEKVSAKLPDYELARFCTQLARDWRESHPSDAIVYGGGVTDESK